MTGNRLRANTRIVAYVPEQAALGPTSLRVVVGGEESNAWELTVAERQGQGRILWSFEADGDNLWYRPAIAPDGTLYVHSNNTTDGIVYANVHMEGSGNGSGYVWAFGLDGEQRFIAPMGGIASHEPVVGSDGTIYCPFGTDGAWGLRAVDPENGSILWQRQPQVANTMTELTIGPDETIYYQASGRLEALDPYTQSLEWIDVNFDVIGWPSVSPDGTRLLVHGVPNYGDPGFIRCYNGSNGNALWEEALPGEPYPGTRVIGTHHARFTPDGSTAYLSTVRLGDGSTSEDPHSFLYAIEIFEAPAQPGDVNGDGVVNVVDLLLVVIAWGPCPGCPEDVTGDGTVDVLDLIEVIAHWG